MDHPLNQTKSVYFTMSLPELEVALEAAMRISKTICQRSGMQSKDYLRAWRMVEEMKAEISARCANQMCAS